VGRDCKIGAGGNGRRRMEGNDSKRQRETGGSPAEADGCDEADEVVVPAAVQRGWLWVGLQTEWV
jgi:hypothetical protein